MTSTPGVMVSGSVIRFELKDGRIVRKYFYGHKTKSSSANRKAFDIARRNISNGFGLAESLAGAKNLAEAMELQTSYWRKQVGELASSLRNAHAIHSGDRGCHSA